MDIVLKYGVGVAATVAAVLVYLMLKPAKIFLDKKRKRVQIMDIKELSHDTKRIRLSLGSKSTVLGLPVGKHIVIYAPNPLSCVSSGMWNGKEDPDKGKAEIDRKYTPVTGNEVPGFVDMVIKVYKAGPMRMPDGKEINWADGGKLGLYLDGKKPGDYIEISGPLGVNEYLGRGTFKLPGRTISVKSVGMMAGGTGLTPMLQVAQAAMRDKGDNVTFSLIYANKTEEDILCRNMLDDLANASGGRFRVYYTLDFPPASWQHKVGFITQEMIKECLPGPSPESLILMCGPPPMIEFACKKNLDALGYTKASMVSF